MTYEYGTDNAPHWDNTSFSWTVYVCSVCNRQYLERMKAEQCQRNHGTMLSAADAEAAAKENA